MGQHLLGTAQGICSLIYAERTQIEPILLYGQSGVKGSAVRLHLTAL